MKQAMQVPKSDEKSPRSVSKRQIWLTVALAIALVGQLIIDWALWDDNAVRELLKSQGFALLVPLGAAVACAILSIVLARNLPLELSLPVIFVLLLAIPFLLYFAFMTWMWWGFTVAG
jgi:hypothetical protein